MANVTVPNPTHLEKVALFRHGIVGDLVVSDLPRGALQDELKHRARRRYRPPGASASRTYHWKTLQRWLYEARKGLEDLEPASRRRGFCLAVKPEVREPLLDIRREHPSASAEIILHHAVANGIVAPDAISLPTLRRLFARAGLPRRSKRRQGRSRDRRKWNADRVCRIWHADVCHVWRSQPDGSAIKAYVHGILDDHSRFLVGLEACVAETENDLLGVLIEALLRYPAPDILYVDNGSTYRGDLLTLALDRLGIRVVHAQPYDPESRGKMERCFRTMRQRLTDHIDRPITLHELNAALLAWVDADYHRRKHAGLMGDAPSARFREGLATLPSPKTTAELADAFVIRGTAKVRKDLTLSVRGTQHEIRGRHLVGKVVHTKVDPFTGVLLSVHHDGQEVVHSVCDPARNAAGRRSKTTPPKASSRLERVANVLQAAREVADDA